MGFIQNKQQRSAFSRQMSVQFQFEICKMKSFFPSRSKSFGFEKNK